MDLLEKFVTSFNWENLMFTLLRVLLILAIAWIALKLAKRQLKKLEQHLVDVQQTSDETPTEQAKRIETLIMPVSKYHFHTDHCISARPANRFWHNLSINPKMIQ